MRRPNIREGLGMPQDRVVIAPGWISADKKLERSHGAIRQNPQIILNGRNRAAFMAGSIAWMKRKRQAEAFQALKFHGMVAIGRGDAVDLLQPRRPDARARCRQPRPRSRRPRRYFRRARRRRP